MPSHLGMDSYILLEHGDPKSARFYPVGHMGITADTMPMILKWVTRSIGEKAP